jgi:hypothetical protein
MEGDDPRLAFCSLLLVEHGSGQCSAAYDCGDCALFQEATADLEIHWVCPMCLPPGREPTGKTLLGYYQEADCYKCGRESSVCQAVVDPGEMTQAAWRELLLEPLRDS